MSKKGGNIWLFIAKAALFFIILAVFYLGQFFFYATTRFYFWGNNIVLMLYAINLFFSSSTFRSMQFGVIDWQEGILSWGLSLIVTNVLQYFLLSLLESMILPVVGFLIVLAAQIILIIPLIYFIDKLYYFLHPAHKAIIIYEREEKARNYSAIIEKHKKRFVIKQAISQNEPMDVLQSSIKAAESVFFIDVDEKRLGSLLEYCFLHDKRSYILPTFSGVLLNAADISWISNTPMFLPKSPAFDPVLLFIKRCMDVFFSIILIILFSWLMLLAWVAIRLYDRHPAIYKQVRVTKGGELFTLYKFRSMRPDAEADGVARLSVRGDDRVTPVGKIIRKTRIDELPQLFNILFGSMSLVGPRPERPEIAKQYEEIYPNFALRTKVKAGMTGYAQIFGRYNTAPDEKLFLDVLYIEKFSILQDIKLILQTVKVVFIPSSTEGVAEDDTTALRTGGAAEGPPSATGNSNDAQ